MSDNEHSEDAVRLRALLEQRSLTAGERAETHLIVELTAAALPVDGVRPSLSVAFAIDVSGSMQGPAIEHVQASMERLVDLLGEDDRVSLVAFAAGASVICDSQRLTAEHKRTLKSRVRRLDVGGGTNIQAGLETARSTLPAREAHERQVILLLSDGEPNQGEVTPEALSAIARGMRPDISVTTLGYGAHHQENVLHAVSEGGGGSYVFISDPSECELELARAIGAQGEVVADGLELLLSPHEGVEVGEVMLSAKPRFTPKGLAIALPDLLDGARRAVVVKLALDPSREHGRWPVARVALRYRRAGETASHELTQDVDASVVQSGGEIDLEANTLVLLARADQRRGEARVIADRGSFDGAAALVRGMLEEIAASPAYKEGDGSDLSEAYEQLLDEAVAYETKPSAESYRSFKRHQMGLEMAAAGSSVVARSSTSVKGQDLMQAVLGEAPEAYLVLVDSRLAGESFRLKADNVIGRSPAADLMVQSSGISRRHTRVAVREGRFFAIDLGSTNGTSVNGRRVRQPTELSAGDEVMVGDVLMRLEIPEPPAASDDDDDDPN